MTQIYTLELGDNTKYAVRGQGTVQFQLESGGSFDVQEVLYVPGLKKNLLSISVMEDKGYEVNFGRAGVHSPKGSQSRHCYEDWSLGWEPL
jgi:hypothetical protein